MLVGAGDALTFISVLSVVAAWFPARQVPLMTQLTGLLGQLGQVLSAVPFAALLHGPGWTTAFVSAAALGVAVGRGGARGAARPTARGAARRRRPRPRGEVLAGLRHAWREPGTRLGLWTHLGTQFSGTVFALLWGVPYLVAGQGLSPAGRQRPAHAVRARRHRGRAAVRRVHRPPPAAPLLAGADGDRG